MTIPAPSEAPDETPRVKDEASGFLSTDCITAPDTESAAPTSQARRTRGSLMSQTMPAWSGGMSVGSGEPEARARRIRAHSAGETYTEPSPAPRRMTRSESAEAMMIRVFSGIARGLAARAGRLLKVFGIDGLRYFLKRADARGRGLRA